MADRTLVFSALGVLGGLAAGYFVGSGGFAGNDVTTLVAEVRHQNHTLDALLTEQESALATSLAECRGVQLNLETSLEGCLFEHMERQRGDGDGSLAETGQRKLRGADTYTETIEYPPIPENGPGSAASRDR